MIAHISIRRNIIQIAMVSESFFATFIKNVPELYSNQVAKYLKYWSVSFLEEFVL